MPTERHRLIPAIATPLRDDFSTHRELLLAHSRDLLARGCDGLAVFGTSGEGPSLGLADRFASLDFLIEAGVAPKRLIVGVGSASLADAVALTRHAVAAGVPDTLLMPAFFLRMAATEEGVYRFYAELIERSSDSRLRQLLYNFPAISGVLLSVELVRRLRESYGAMLHGIKDSGSDWDQTSAYLDAFPELTIYTGTEVHVRRTTAKGGVGTICGLGNIVPQAMRRYMDAPGEEEAARWEALIKAVGAAVTVQPFFPSCKAVISMTTGAEDWRRILPPLAPLDDADFARLSADLGSIAEKHGLPVG
jgi:4-hydroxy-tetrahydrodipicolinate synthase